MAAAPAFSLASLGRAAFGGSGLVHSPECTWVPWTDDNVRTWTPCESCRATTIEEAKACYRDETGGNETYPDYENFFGKDKYKGHGQWASRVGYEEGRRTWVGLRLRCQSASPAPKCPRAE